jgi:organic hydroperoxide reductase OsmC/OhrA
MNVNMPGVARDVAAALVHDAEQLCPYSKAMRGSVDAAISIV